MTALTLEQRGPHPARPCPRYAGYEARHLPPVYRLHGGCTRCPAEGPCEQEEARARELAAEDAQACAECNGLHACAREPEHAYRPRGAVA